ncbi:polysaccharide deacetylase family protein [Neobacillus sp. Marseille-QA0830]
MKMAQIGILFDRTEAQARWSKGTNVFENYIFEVLDHLRIPYQKVDTQDEYESFDVLVAALCGDAKETSEKLLNYIRSGGVAISYGGLDGLKQLLGVSSSPAMEKGYAFLNGFLNQSTPLRFLSADYWVNPQRTITGEGYLKQTNQGTDQSHFPALQIIDYGLGRIERWSVPIPQAIVGLQQGTLPITEDGIPAPDGSANLDEGILKADDGFELDWVLDRVTTETDTPYFPHPYADLWREALIEHLLTTVTKKGMTLPILDYWPAGISQMAMISHDSDLNVDESAKLTLSTLKAENVNTTWCMIAPGFSREVYEQIQSDGHELAMHYNALEQEDGIWSEEAFSHQLEWLRNAAGIQDVVSNKNHYTRFEGWGELFRWCENHGIQVDQSRGPSKKGNIGFLFGTSHPFFPVAWADEKNRFYDVLEIGFLTQDLNHHALADTTVIQPFLDGVKRVNGVAHFLFHQYHIHTQPKVREAIIQVIRTAKSQGFTFWTSRQINQWERGRRNIELKWESGEAVATGVAERDDLCVLIPVGNTVVQDGKQEHEIVERFGIPCMKMTLTVNIPKEA